MHLQKQLSGRGSKRKATPTGDATPEVLLLHSRFLSCRSAQPLVARALGTAYWPREDPRINSGRRSRGSISPPASLITEIAPWPSLVQRLGRCNRAGEFEEASIFWSTFPQTGTADSPGDLNASREKLSLEGACVSPASLPEVGLAYSADYGDGYETDWPVRHHPRISRATTLIPVGSYVTRRTTMSTYSGETSPRARLRHQISLRPFGKSSCSVVL